MSSVEKLQLFAHPAFQPTTPLCTVMRIVQQCCKASRYTA